MSARSTIGLIVAFAVLVGAYVLYGVTERVRERRFEEAKRMFEFDAADVQSLVIEQDGARPIAGTRNADGWSIERPEGIPANALVWDRVSDALSMLKSERTVAEAPDDVSEFELDPPLLAIDATLKDGQSIRVTAGAQDPFQTHRYARIDDGNVFLISEDAFFELNRSLLWLRDRDLVAGGESGIRRVEFVRYAQSDTGDVKRGAPSKVVATERNESDGRWMLTEPVEGIADQPMVEALVQEIRFGKGHGYIDDPEDLDDYGLEVPGVGLTVYPYDGPPMTIYYGNVANKDENTAEVYVRQEGRDAVFLADGHVINLFPRTPDAFLEKRILPRPGSELKALELVWGDTDLRLELNEARSWRIVRPIEDAADAVAVSELIGGLVGIVGAGYFTSDQDVFGFDGGDLRVRLELEGEDEPIVIRTGKLRPDGRYFIEQASGGVTTVLKEDVDPLMLDVYHFREKRLFDFRPDDVATVSMKLRDTDYEFEVSGGRWAVRKPEGLIWETQSDMDVLLSAIAEARYEAIEADAAPDDLAPFGLAEDATLEFKAKVTQPDVRNVGPFRIGKPAEDNSQQRFATVAGRPEIFRVPQSIIDTIEEARRGLAEK